MPCHVQRSKGHVSQSSYGLSASNIQAREKERLKNFPPSFKHDVSHPGVNGFNQTQLRCSTGAEIRFYSVKVSLGTYMIPM